MKVKLSKMKLRPKFMSSKKGFIFTLDVALGIIISLMVIAVSVYFMTRGSESSLPQYQLLTTGSDIITVLDKQNVFDALNPSTIENQMGILLPSRYGMLIRIQGNFSQSGGIIEAGDEIPLRVNTLTGRRIALIDPDTYIKITYFMWVKPQ